MNYFWLTIKHKWFVFLAGLKTGVPLWRLIIHDWSKFTPSELPHYQRQFFGDKDDPLGFAAAWLHHQNHNPHHWEYWLPRSGHAKHNDDERYKIQAHGDGYPLWIYDFEKEKQITPKIADDFAEDANQIYTLKEYLNNIDLIPIDMPEWAIREMIADWMGAARAYEGQWPVDGNWEWMDTHCEKIKTRISKRTQSFISQIFFLMMYTETSKMWE